MEKALTATPIINSEHKLILEKAKEITGMDPRPVERARRIFNFVRDEVSYNFVPEVKREEDLKASHTLGLGNGFCVQKAVLFTALCRASGIPAKIGFQHICSHKIVGKILEFRGSNEFYYHGLTSAYLNGKWIKLDCTLDRNLVTRKGYVLVEFSPDKDVLFPKYDLVGEPHFDILAEHGFFFDVPPEVVKHFIKHFGSFDYESWKALVRREDLCY